MNKCTFYISDCVAAVAIVSTMLGGIMTEEVTFNEEELEMRTRSGFSHLVFIRVRCSGAAKTQVKFCVCVCGEHKIKIHFF